MLVCSYECILKLFDFCGRFHANTAITCRRWTSASKAAFLCRTCRMPLIHQSRSSVLQIHRNGLTFQAILTVLHNFIFVRERASLL